MPMPIQGVPFYGQISDSATNTTLDIAVWSRSTSGTAAASLGVGLLLRLQDDGGTMENAARIQAVWTNAGAAAEASRLDFQARTGGAALTTYATLSSSAFTLPGPELRVGTGTFSAGHPIEISVTGNEARIRSLSSSTGGLAGMLGVSNNAISVQFFITGSAFGAPLLGTAGTGNDHAYLRSDATDGLTIGTAVAGIVEISYNDIVRATWGSAGVVFNENSNDYDFRIEGNGAANLFVLDAGNDSITLTSTAQRFKIDGTGVSFFTAATAAQQVSGANLTNNVTSGGTDNTVDNIVAASVDATAADLVTTRNACYQLARKLKQINDGLRTYGLFT